MASAASMPSRSLRAVRSSLALRALWRGGGFFPPASGERVRRPSVPTPPSPHPTTHPPHRPRRHLTAEQKRELIAKLIKATPEKSDRQIAETVKASPTTVGTVRAEMEAKGDLSKLDTRRDSKGRKQPAARTSGRKKKTTTQREMKELKEATGKQKQKVTNDIICLIAELVDAHGECMEMFVRQCLAEYAKEVVRACPEAPSRAMWIECARLVLKKLNIAVDEMPDIPDFLQRAAS